MKCTECTKCTELHALPHPFYFSFQFALAMSMWSRLALNIVILLPQPLKYWDYGHMLPCLGQQCYLSDCKFFN